MSHKKLKDLRSRTTLISVQNELARPRISKSARIAERNLDKARSIPGTVAKLIRSPRPSQAEKAQISIAGDQGYRDLRIENSLTDEHGDEVKLKKGAHVDVTVTGDADALDPKAVADPDFQRMLW